MDFVFFKKVISFHFYFLYIFFFFIKEIFIIFERILYLDIRLNLLMFFNLFIRFLFKIISFFFKILGEKVDLIWLLVLIRLNFIFFIIFLDFFFYLFLIVDIYSFYLWTLQILSRYFSSLSKCFFDFILINSFCFIFIPWFTHYFYKN